MPYMTADQIRQAFLDFFGAENHTRLPSSSLVPQGDPTLLFTNAGMVQFKEVFLGTQRRPYARATTAQKCVRAGGKHNDLDVVGRTARHHTFFEMLGNFSFGDYFKREAIGYAWQFITEVMGIPGEQLWVTVFQDDDEAFSLWQEVTGIPASRIVRLGMKDNFWSMGDTGPCGPCSEIMVDRGAHLRCDAPVCGLGACDCDRWLEIWNLVFMQFDRDQNGVMTPLPKPSIDTGMGLERIASVVQDVPSNWDTDVFRPLLARVAELSGQAYTSGDGGFPHRVIADHARACTFLVADGVVPSNEGRGYVLRRILRRGVRYGRKLGLGEGSFATICSTVTESMGAAYPELMRNRDFAVRVITAEETRFGQALATGLTLLDRVIDEVAQRGERTVPGEDVFRLYDTYGFPPELTEEIAEERGLAVDRMGFDQAMARQRDAARAAMRFGAGPAKDAVVYAALDVPATTFIGYDTAHGSSVVVGLLVGGEPVATAIEGQAAELLAIATPFYPEGGGQVGDHGEIRAPAGNFVVEDTQKVRGDLIVHRGRVTAGTVSTGEEIDLQVDLVRRRETARHHTATHLLHAALRDVLGGHVQQAGSLVTPERLRFDFSHPSAPTADELERIERLVNDRVRDNLLVQTRVLSYHDAIASGALAFFGEKYGDEVRMLAVGPQAVSTAAEEPTAAFSIELCGGTHLRATGEAGLFLIVSEGSVGAGVRRIEAVVGEAAQRSTELRRDLVDRLAQRLGGAPGELEQRVSALLDELERERKRGAQIERDALRSQVDDLLAQARMIGSVTVLAVGVAVPDMAALRQTGDWLRDRLQQNGVVILGAVVQDKPSFLVMVTRDLVERGVHAGKIANQVSSITGGKAGGRPEMATGGGGDGSKLPGALEQAYTIVSEALA